MKSRSRIDPGLSGKARPESRAGNRGNAIAAPCEETSRTRPGTRPRRSAVRPAAKPATKREMKQATGGSHSAKGGAVGEPAPLLARVEVMFYKEILDHRGFAHRCELARMASEAAEFDAALAGAILAFERAHRVGNWTIAADGYEVETGFAAAQPAERR